INTIESAAECYECLDFSNQVILNLPAGERIRTAWQARSHILNAIQSEFPGLVESVSLRSR
ncbi:MAG: hypothetical protein KDA96_26305, partial [Planctomycetaceae bacterium]|nr:hypothetical protein [Planctomycetaceae bacterium]